MVCARPIFVSFNRGLLLEKCSLCCLLNVLRGTSSRAFHHLLFIPTLLPCSPHLHFWIFVEVVVVTQLSIELESMVIAEASPCHDPPTIDMKMSNDFKHLVTLASSSPRRLGSDYFTRDFSLVFFNSQM